MGEQFLDIFTCESLHFLRPPPQKADKAANTSLAVALWSWILIIMCSSFARVLLMSPVR